MKKIIGVFLSIVMVFAIFAACDSNGTQSQSITKLLENSRLDLTDAKSVGLVKRGAVSSGVKNNVLVTVNEENEINDAEYKKPENGTETDVEVSAWYIRNLKVTDNFIFIYYVNYECNMVSDKFLSTGDKDQSFAIHKQTGKVFSLSELPDIDMIIENGDFLRYNDKFYKATVLNNELKLTRLSSNDDVKEFYAMEDKWGNIYVQNDSINEQKVNNLYYYKDGYSDFYGLGDDGVIYKTYTMYNSTSNTHVEYFDEDMQSIPVTAPLSVAVKSVVDNYGLGFIRTNYFIFNNNNCFYIEDCDSFMELRGIQWELDSFGYTGYTDTWGISYKNKISFENIYFIDGQIIVATETELAHFDMASYAGWGTAQLTKITDYNSAELKGNILTITTQGIQGVSTSLVYVENGQVKTKLLSEVFYDAEIITIQSLN